MTIRFEIPEHLAQQLRAAGIDLKQTARESLLVELYRQKHITHHQLAQALGYNRYETDGVLKRHGVEVELSLDEFQAQAQSLRELRRQ